jgi:plastocyanin
MLEQLWTSILELISQLVIPDWGVLIGFIPVGVLILVVVVFMWLFRRLMTAPPPRRGKRPLRRATPAGIHMPGPSWAPVFGAAGLFLLMLGLVFGGPSLILGIIALVLTLLYWLAEGLRIYDRDTGQTTTTQLPAVVHDGPPPGVHMPGPSWRPFLGAFGLFALLLGLVFGGWLLAAGVIVLISTLVGWLADAIREYRRTVEADRTGHLDSGQPPPTPSRMLTVLTFLIVGAAVLQSGIFATGPANGGTVAPGTSGAPAASGAPAPSGAAPSGPAATGPATPASGGPPPASGPAADVTVTAKGIAFDPTTWTGPAGRPFTIAFANEDAGTPHDIQLKDGSGAIIWKGDVFNGVETRTYQVPALPAGQYKFDCVIHPSMTGTATLQ